MRRRRRRWLPLFSLPPPHPSFFRTSEKLTPRASFPESDGYNRSSWNFPILANASLFFLFLFCLFRTCFKGGVREISFSEIMQNRRRRLLTFIFEPWTFEIGTRRRRQQRQRWPDGNFITLGEFFDTIWHRRAGGFLFSSLLYFRIYIIHSVARPSGQRRHVFILKSTEIDELGWWFFSYRLDPYFFSFFFSFFFYQYAGWEIF